MSIYLYSGAPGNGKSYCAVKDVILPAAKKGLLVYTNIPLRLENWTGEVLGSGGRLPIQFKTDDIVKNMDWFQEVFQAGALLVFDEPARLWPSGITQRDMQHQHLEFLTQHRHMVSADGISTNIVLVTQDSSQIAKCVRVLVEQHYIITKMSRVGLNSVYEVDVYSRIQREDYPSENQKIQKYEGKYQEKYYNLYISHTMAQQVGMAGNELKTVKPRSMFTIRYLLFAFGSLGALVYFSMSFVGWVNDLDEIGQEEKIVKKEEVETEVDYVQVNAVRREEFKQQEKQYELSNYRIVGYIMAEFDSHFNMDDVVLITDGRELIRIKAEDCQIYQEKMECIYKGRRLTEWSGQELSNSTSSVSVSF